MDAALNAYGTYGIPCNAPGGTQQLASGIPNVMAAKSTFGADASTMGREAQFMNSIEMGAMNMNAFENAVESQIMQPFMNVMMQFLQMQMANLQGTNGSPIDKVVNKQENNADKDGKNNQVLNKNLNKDLQGGSALGEKIADRAEANAEAYNTPGKCLQEAGEVLREFGIPVNRHPAAYQALPDLQKSDKVKEIKVSKEQLDNLPAGAIVVWDKGAGLPYGHISVALGDGREASSTVRNQLALNTEYHVFIPVG
ncbi:MAG: hypothetical protein AB9903_03925 [Vulcanimicrobiota bacterium]